MKVDSIVAVEITDQGYDVTIKTSGGNFAIAHCNESFTIQNVSRVEKQQDDTFRIVDQYSVIPQECRVAVADIKEDSDVINTLLMEGIWNNKHSVVNN